MITLEIPAPEFVKRFQSGEISTSARVTVTYEGQEEKSPGGTRSVNTDQVRAKLHEEQEETATQTTPSISAQDLFHQWDAQDASMSEKERLTENQLWDEFEKGINDNRAALGMRQL